MNSGLTFNRQCIRTSSVVLWVPRFFCPETKMCLYKDNLTERKKLYQLRRQSNEKIIWGFDTTSSWFYTRLTLTVLCTMLCYVLRIIYLFIKTHGVPYLLVTLFVGKDYNELNFPKGPTTRLNHSRGTSPVQDWKGSRSIKPTQVISDEHRDRDVSVNLLYRRSSNFFGL